MKLCNELIIIIKNALLSALPYLVMWMFSIVISQVADWLNRQKIATITTIRKAANTICNYRPFIDIANES